MLDSRPGERPVRRPAILLAEDDPTLGDAIRRFFEAHGAQVTLARDGAAALVLARATGFDVIVTDVRMPLLSGVELLRSVKASQPDVEFVLISGQVNTALALECLREGAVDLVPKPLDLDLLWAVVERALERGRSGNAARLVLASRVIFEAHDPAALPAAITDIACQMFKADDVSLLVPEGQTTLRLAHAPALPPEVASEVRVVIGEGLAGGVAATGTPLLFNGEREDSTSRAAPGVPPVRSSLIVPLISKAGLLGVLNINRRGQGARPFRESDLDLARLLGAQILLVLETQLAQAQMVRVEALASLGELAAATAHELASPATYARSAIRYFQEHAELFARIPRALSADTPQSERDELLAAFGGVVGYTELLLGLGEVQEGVERISDLVGDMKGLARSQGGAAQVIDVNDALRSALRLAAYELRPVASVVTELGDGLWVRANVARLSQVFINLLVNAAHALAECPGQNRRVVVRSTRTGDTIRVTVADNGPGIPVERRSRIFDPFFTTKPEGKGTGLGLPISRAIVVRLGGTLTVHAAPEGGSLFQVDLPAPEEA